jgi:methionine-rich copper-binding protein CopC
MRLAFAPGLAALLLVLPVPALAHAIIVAAEPAGGAVLHGPKAQVLLRFNSRIDVERSRLTLMSPDGTARPLVLAPSDGPDTLAATMDGLGAGAYRLRWQVLAVDGHITRGDIPFTVAP